MYFTKIPTLLHKLYPQATWSSHNNPKLQWTFDDGPNPDSTPAILAFLKAQGLKATFFCLGSNVVKYPKLYQEILEDGHQVGNHGYHHISGWASSVTTYMDNVSKAQMVIDSNLFRPAYGRMTRNQYNTIISRSDFEIVMWSHMPGDFDKDLSATKLGRRLNKINPNNSITVLHDEPQAFDKLQLAWSRKSMDLDISLDSRN